MTTLAQTNPARQLGADSEAFAAAGGDARVFAAVFRIHYADIHGYLRRRTGDTHLAEDLAAETFVAAWRAAHRFTDRGIPVRAWLMRIATNQANRWASRRAGRERRRVLWMWATARREVFDEVRPDEGDALRVQRALLDLSVDQQAVLCLHHVEGLSVEETALVLGVAEGTVKSRLHRAREAFRARLCGGAS